jgi:hypothetical protein
MKHSIKTIEAAKRFVEAYDKRNQSRLVLSVLKTNMNSDLTPKGRAKKVHLKIYEEACNKHEPLAIEAEQAFHDLKASMHEDACSNRSIVVARMVEIENAILAEWRDCGPKDITSTFIKAQEEYFIKCSEGWHEDSKTSYQNSIDHMKNGYTVYIDIMGAVKRIIGNVGSFNTDGLHSYLKFNFRSDGRLNSVYHTTAEGDFKVREYGASKHLCHEFHITHSVESLNFCAYGTKSAGVTAVDAASRIVMASISGIVSRFIKENEDLYPRGLYDSNFETFVDKARAIASTSIQ